MCLTQDDTRYCVAIAAYRNVSVHCGLRVSYEWNAIVIPCIGYTWTTHDINNFYTEHSTCSYSVNNVTGSEEARKATRLRRATVNINVR